MKAERWIWGSISVALGILVALCFRKMGVPFYGYAGAFVCVGSFLVCWSWKRNLIQAWKNSTATKRTVQLIASLLCAAVCIYGLFLVMPKEVFPDTKLVVRVAGDRDERSHGNEVWILKIDVNGKSVDLSELPLTEGWEMSNTSILARTGSEPADLPFYFEKAKTVELTFNSHAWSGMVQVVDGTKVTDYNLYSDESTKRVHTIRAGIAARYYLPMGMLAALVAALSSTLVAYGFALWKRFPSVPIKLQAVIYLLICLNLFMGMDQQPSMMTSFALGGLSVLFFLGYREMRKEQFRIGERIAICAVAVYASFASYGYRLFLSGTRMHIDFASVKYFTLGILWFIPAVYAMLYVLHGLHKKVQPATRTKAQINRARIVIFLCLLLSQIAIVLSFWPGGFPTDCFGELDRATGHKPLYAHASVLHDLMLRVVYWVVPKAGASTVIQGLFFVLLCTSALMIAYRRGVPLWAICIGGCAFVLLPNQVFSSILTEKDFSYCLALFWGCLLLYRLAVKEEICKTRRFAVWLGVDMFFIFAFRHNGMVPFVFMVIACIILGIRNMTAMQKKSIVSAGLAVGLAVVYQGPVFTLLNVIPNDVSPAMTMLCGIGSCINKDLPLSEKTTEFMEGILSAENWKEYYGRFLGHDRIIYSNGPGWNTSDLKLSDVFAAYFDALFRYPDVVIKDRLDGMNIMWDVTQPADEDSFNTRQFAYVTRLVHEEGHEWREAYFDLSKLERASNGIYYNRSWVAEKYRKLLSLDTLGDLLIWRSGAYIILSLVLMLYWRHEKLKHIWWMAIPHLGNVAGLMLLLYHQSFRYIHPVQMLSVLLMLFTLCTPRERDSHKNDRCYIG